MTTFHVYFALRNQQAFQRLLDAARSTNTQTTSGPALSSSGGRSWNRPSVLSGGLPAASLDVNARDCLGRTVLHLAVSALDPAALEFVKLLLTHPRIDVNIADLESRWTPLHRALYAGNIPACVLLLQRPDIDVSLKDLEGYTAFDVYNSTVEGTKPNESEVMDLYTWGTNRNAALGVGDGDDRAFAELVPITSQKEHAEPFKLPLRTRFQAIRAKRVAMGKLHTAVITSEPHANLRICGFGSGGRLGSGAAQHTQYAFSTPKDLTSEANIIAIALGQDHTLALTSSGSVLSWGLNRFSQLGYALDGGQTLQTTPRRIVGPLRREIVVGVSACRTASACWTKDELFTWGTNNGQLGYDRVGTPVQMLPRRVTQITLPVIDIALSDVGMAVLLSSRDVHCFYNGRSFKISFPTQSFPSEIQVYRPPMAQHNASIAKVVSCDNTFAALSLNGEVFTFMLNAPPSMLPTDSATMPYKNVGVTPVKPQRIWALRKQYSAVKDVALGSDGTILLCTESGHVYLRSRTNKTSKFSRVPLVQRAVSVAASSAGAFAVLKAECTPTPIRVEGNTVAEDLEMIQPYFLPSGGEEWEVHFDSAESNIGTPPSSGGSLESPRSPSDDGEAEAEDDPDSTSIKKDVKMIARLVDLLISDALQRKTEGKGIFEGVNIGHGADLFIRVDSAFEFPVHRVILAARSEVLKDVLLGQILIDSKGRVRCQLAKNNSLVHPRMVLSGIHALSVLMLAVYLYTDEMPAIWDRRVGLAVSDKLAECVPKTNATNIRTDLQRLAALFNLPALIDVLDAPVKRLPAVRLTHDMQALLNNTLREPAWAFDSPLVHPLAPDTLLELADALVCCHSTILRARSPFFSGLFGDPEWTVKRKEPNNPLVVQLKHMRWRAMEFVMQFIYAGGDEEIFDVLEFAHAPDDVLEFLFEVIDVAGELLLDRLLLTCSSIILRFLNINNACSILSDASHFNASQLCASVQGYLARNVETLLESRMLDDLPTHLIRQFAEFIRARQAEKLPATRSGKLVERALEKWKDWLELQDIPQPIVPGRKTSSNHIRQSPKLSPDVCSTPGKRNRRPAVVQTSASYSPPQDLRLPLTPPSAPIQEGIETAPDDVFVMDDIREDIPPLTLPSSQASLPSATPQAGSSLALGTYSPWKSRVSQLSTSKLDLRAIMAEAESQRAASSPSTTPPARSRVVGFDSLTSMSPVRTPQKLDPAHVPAQPKAGPSSPWRLMKADPSSGRAASPSISSPVLARKRSDSPQGSVPSGLSQDLRDNQIPGSPPAPSPSSSSLAQSSQSALGKGKAPLGPTFAPARQISSVSAVPITRRVSEGTTKAWNTIPPPLIPEPKQSDGEGSSNTPMSFLAIQQQQRDQNAGPASIRKSLLEIQAEEQAQAEEERALLEEVEFMRWWTAEEERIRRETQAQPGPPVSVRGAGGNHRGGKKGKSAGAGTRKTSLPNKRSVQHDIRAPVQCILEVGGGDKERVAVADGQKSDRRRRGKPKTTPGDNKFDSIT